MPPIVRRLTLLSSFALVFLLSLRRMADTDLWGSPCLRKVSSRYRPYPDHTLFQLQLDGFSLCQSFLAVPGGDRPGGAGVR